MVETKDGAEEAVGCSSVTFDDSGPSNELDDVVGAYVSDSSTKGWADLSERWCAPALTCLP